MATAISKIDHIAITARDIDELTRFYCAVLGAEMGKEYHIDGQLVMRQCQAGGALINIHQSGHTSPLVAARPTPGAIDLCFRWEEPVATAIAHLHAHGVEIVDGPSARVGSGGEKGMSVYFRDPDGNLLEFLSIAEGWTKAAEF